MASKADLQSLFFNKGEAEHELELFEKQPVLAMARYLECFDENGKQVFKIPDHLIQFLRLKFGSVMSEEFGSVSV